MMDINKLRRLALDGDLAAMQAIVIHLEQVEKERDDLRAAMLCMERTPYEIIGKILTEVMDIAVSNGADSRSMPDTRRQTRVDSERADATLWSWKGLQRIGRRYRHSATPLQAGAYSEHTAQHKPSA